MRADYDLWIIDDVPDVWPCTITARRIINPEAIGAAEKVEAVELKSATFVIVGARLERGQTPDDPDWMPAFDSFTLDGEDPDRLQDDTYSDEIRDLVWDALSP